MKINYRQLSVIVFYLLGSLKFFGLPALIYINCKVDSWLVFLGIIITDLVFLTVVLYLMKTSNEKNFYEFLKHRFGTVITKVIIFLYFAISILDIFAGITGLQRLLLENFYTDLKWYVYLIPLLIVMAYMAYKGLRNIGRVCEMFVWLIIVGLVFIILKGIPKTELTFFLPMLQNGVIPVLKGYLSHISWYGTPLVLLFFIGKVDFSQYKKSLMIRYVAIAVVIILGFVAVFYGVFKSTAGLHSFAISDLSQISNSSTALDELSWLVVGVFMVAHILQLTLIYYVSILCFRYIFNVNNSWFPILIVNCGLIAYENINSLTVDLEKLFYSSYVVGIELFVKFGVLSLILIFNAIYKKRTKNHAKT